MKLNIWIGASFSIWKPFFQYVIPYGDIEKHIHEKPETENYIWPFYLREG